MLSLVVHHFHYSLQVEYFKSDPLYGVRTPLELY